MIATVDTYDAAVEEVEAQLECEAVARVARTVSAQLDTDRLQNAVVLVESARMQLAMRSIVQARGFKAMHEEVNACMARVHEELRGLPGGEDWIK